MNKKLQKMLEVEERKIKKKKDKEQRQIEANKVASDKITDRPVMEPTDTCNAKTRTREGYCKLPAGFGTNHQMEGRCKFHGGATSSINRTTGAFEKIYRKCFGESMIKTIEAIRACHDPALRYKNKESIDLIKDIIDENRAMQLEIEERRTKSEIDGTMTQESLDRYRLDNRQIVKQINMLTLTLKDLIEASGQEGLTADEEFERVIATTDSSGKNVTITYEVKEKK